MGKRACDFLGALLLYWKFLIYMYMYNLHVCIYFLVNAGLSCFGLVIIHDFSTDKVGSQIVFQVIEIFVVVVVVLPRPKFCRGC